MQTERGLDRLTYFTDAIAAIAITLLVLPLVDRVGEAHDANLTPVEFLQENTATLGAFLLSFFVIARLWSVHHSIFEHVVQYTPRLRWISIVWAFTIVLLPLPTAIVAEWSPSPFVMGFYIGTMSLSSIILSTILVYVRRHPTVESAENPVTEASVRSSILSSAAFLVALAAGTLIPGVTYFGLLLLFLSPPLSALIGARRKARAGDA